MKSRINLFTIVILTTLVTLAFVDIAKGFIVTDGLVSYWSFDKATIKDKTVKDIWGSSDGTIFGNAKIVEGKFGEALGLEKNEFAHVQFDDSKMPSGNDPRTLSAWVKQDILSVGFGAVVEWGTNVQPQRSGILITSAGGVYFVGCCADMPSNGTTNLGEWNHVVITYDGTVLKTYINNKLDKIGAPIDVCGNNQVLKLDTKLGVGRIGANVVWTENFIGYIDEVSIYRKAISADEVQQNFESKGFEKESVDSTGKLALTWGEVKVSE